MTDGTVFSIGHSTHTIAYFVGLLQEAKITAIADVRSTPYSRFQPQFNRPELQAALKSCKIAYVFLGDELGARSDDPGCYEEGKVKYARLAKTAAFKSGIARVIRGRSKYSISLMCAEKEPLDCHRTLLVGRQLELLGVSVAHIHANGQQETHASAVERLLRIAKLPNAELFRSRNEILEEAYAYQEARTAYVKTDVTSSRVKEQLTG